MSDKENNQDKPEKQSNFPTVSLPDSSAVIGGEIGPYKLLSVLGEGGFGIVYLAEQKRPVKRQVALKIIKPGMDSKQVIARFEAEQQALALLEHPNIAHVFRAGSTETGRPYFAMEYIKGMLITEYCDHNKLSIKERLELFIQVCEAVQHAHQKGIIHRDIKPSNIIVSTQDGKPVPKVIDFGVAKAISMPLTEKTMFTQQGQLIGTPEYMSPEQADLKEKDIDTRTDIYSLGVVLYELLAGTLPFEPETLREGGFAEIQRIIREEEPPRPSTKLSSLGDRATEVALSRHIELPALVKSLHKELEWIPLMAIRKERDQRYKTASDLAEDVQNYLEGNPLVAGPESAAYRMKKFIKKRRGLVGAVGSIVAILLITIPALIVNTQIALRSEKDARASEKRALVAEKEALEEKNKTQKALSEAERNLYNYHIGSADMAIKSHHPENARELLDACPKVLRGWEWNRLYYVLNSRWTTINSPNAIYSLSFSPDGKRIASASYKDAIRIWDTDTGSELMTLSGHTDTIRSVCFSLDGKRIVSGSSDKTLKLWDAESGNEIKTLEGHSHKVYSVGFSPDGKRIVSGSRDKTIKIWDADTGDKIQTLKGHSDYVNSVAFSPDGQRIVSGSNDKTIKIWDAYNGSELMSMSGHEEGIHSVCFTLDNKQVISVDMSGITLWNAISGDKEKTVSGRYGWGMYGWDVCFSPDRKQIALGSNSTVKILDAKTGSLLQRTFSYNKGLGALCYSPDGTRIASGDKSGIIKIWNLESPSSEWTEKTIQENIFFFWGPVVSRVSFSPDGKHIASINVINFFEENVKEMKGSITIWDIDTKSPLHTLSGQEGSFMVLCFSPKGNWIASQRVEEIRNGNLEVGPVTIWDVETGQEVKAVGDNSKVALALSFSPDGKHIFFLGQNLDDDLITKETWDIESGNLIQTLNCNQDISIAFCFSPNRKQFLSYDEKDYSLDIWDAETGEHVKTLGHLESELGSVCFSPDGKLVASISGDIFDYDKGTTFNIWDSETGDDIKKLKGHEDVVLSACFTPDGRRLILGNIDGTVSILDLETGRELLGLSGHNGPVSSVCVSPDGRFIASSEQMGNEITIWGSASPEEVLKKDPPTQLEIHRIMREEKLNGQIEKFQEACELSNWKFHEYIYQLAALHSEAGNWAKAIEYQQKAIDLLPMEGQTEWLGTYKILLELYKSNKPHDSMAKANNLTQMAWPQINSLPDDSIDIQQIVNNATRACELINWKFHKYIYVLATAHSEAGNWEKAIEYQQKAIDLLPMEEQSEWLSRYESLLELYKSFNPYHERNSASFSNGELVAHWEFDEINDKIVVDISHNKLNSELIGNAKIVEDKERGAVLRLDGNGSYVDCGDNWMFDITGSITVSVWIRVNEFGPKHDAIISKGDGAWRLARYVDANSIEFACSGISNNYHGFIGGDENINDDQWHHIAGVYDGKKISLYIDSMLDISEEATGNISSSYLPVLIGAAPDFNDRYWNGYIDDVRIYSYALSKEEISDLYKEESVKPEN